MHGSCSKILNFEAVCYTANANWYKVLEEVSKDRIELRGRRDRLVLNVK